MKERQGFRARIEQAAAEMKAGRSSIFLVLGAEEMQRKEAQKALVSAWLGEGDRSFGLETVDLREEPVEKVEEVVKTPSLLGERQVLLLRNYKEEKRIDGILMTPFPEGTKVVIVADAVDRRKSLYRYVEKEGVVLEIPSVDGWSKAGEASLLEVIRARFAEEGKRIDPMALRLLIEKMGACTGMLDGEIAKLVCFTGQERERIGVDDVEMVVSSFAETPAYLLADHVGNRDVERSIRTLRELFLRNENALAILSALAARFRLLIQAGELLREDAFAKALPCGRYNAPVMEKAIRSIQYPVESVLPRDSGSNVLKQHPYRIWLFMLQSEKHDMKSLLEGFDEIVGTWHTLISTSLDAQLALERLVLKLCGEEKKQRR